MPPAMSLLRYQLPDGSLAAGVRHRSALSRLVSTQGAQSCDPHGLWVLPALL